ncbi:hypothetical protein MCC93_06700 [Morococcus cerebrosus]|uniref:Uncharacterized protein n=1 Tax=Morococcus cerebrosus TaxID=1056807 RepID=A0A0C1GWU9_9NEIS|nr:hypothetical protein MCC93_06700 [Morococcus cerebrosus]
MGRLKLVFFLRNFNHCSAYVFGNTFPNICLKTETVSN